MALNTVRIQINGTWHNLTYNSSSGKWEATVTAPTITSFNLANKYYPTTVEAKDTAGNATTADSTHATLGTSLRLVVKETTKPTITITAPGSGTFTENNRIPITFQLRDEANGSGIKIDSLSFKVNSTTYTNVSAGMVVTPVTNGYNVTYTPPVAAVLPDGSVTITINVSDNDGNAATQATRTFTVATVAPQLNVTNPSSDVLINVKNITVQGIATDPTTNEVVTIKLNGVDQGTITLDGSGNFAKALTLVEGVNTIIVRATGQSGLYTEVTRVVTVDTIAPVITAITITPNPSNTGATLTISVTVTD